MLTKIRKYTAILALVNITFLPQLTQAGDASKLLTVGLPPEIIVCNGIDSVKLLPFYDGKWQGTKVRFKFKRSSQPATKGVGKGYCAFLNKSMSSRLPNEVEMKLKGAYVRPEIVTERYWLLMPSKVNVVGKSKKNKKILKAMLDNVEKGKRFQFYGTFSRKLITMKKYGP